jgi:hypothetical protein
MRNDPIAPPHGPKGSGPIRAREAGLALTRRVNRWMIGGAVILTGGVSTVTAHAFHARSPGVTSSSATAPAARRSTSGAHRSASTASSSGSGQGASLQAPSQAPTAAVPAPATAPAPVVSGGS